jgi:hypothetical protein
VILPQLRTRQQWSKRWATTQYVYAFGPLKRFGNLLVPNWATTNSGLVRYEMVSLTASNERPDLSLFAAPAEMGGGAYSPAVPSLAKQREAEKSQPE